MRLALEEYRKEHSLEELKPHSGTIWICTQAVGDCALVLIGDNGSGMTPEVCHRLFDPFFTTKAVGSGTGLGMSISYQMIVEKHGGQLQCISAPDQGAAFLIQIPVEQPKKRVFMDESSGLSLIPNSSEFEGSTSHEYSDEPLV